MTEKSGAEFASRHEGMMHACGHDGHMSMVLGLANHIAETFDELPRNVLLVFQPAEETTGGADIICKSGVFERYNVDRMFGYHLWPDLRNGLNCQPTGRASCGNERIDVHLPWQGYPHR